MTRARSLLIGLLLVGLAISFTGGLQGVTSASELDFCKLLSMITPGVVYIVTDTSSGSGFIVGYVSEDPIKKYVVTNWHVVADAVVGNTPITVSLPQRSDPNKLCSGGGDIHLTQLVPARVVRANPSHDLALLVMETTNPRVWFGNSDRVNLGDNVFVIGYPAPLPTVCYGSAGQIVPCDAPLTITQEQIADIFQSQQPYEVVTLDGQVYALGRNPIQTGKIKINGDEVEVMVPVTKADIVNIAGLEEIIKTIQETKEPILVIADVQWATPAFAVANPAERIEVKGVDKEILELNLVGEAGEEKIQIKKRFIIVDSVNVTAVTSPAEQVSYGFAQVNRDWFITRQHTISPGNSGGPMFNSSGQVIGVATQDSSTVRYKAEWYITSKKVIEALKLEELEIRIVN